MAPGFVRAHMSGPSKARLQSEQHEESSQGSER